MRGLILVLVILAMFMTLGVIMPYYVTRDPKSKCNHPSKESKAEEERKLKKFMLLSNTAALEHEMDFLPHSSDDVLTCCSRCQKGSASISDLFTVNEIRQIYARKDF